MHGLLDGRERDRAGDADQAFHLEREHPGVVHPVVGEDGQPPGGGEPEQRLERRPAQNGVDGGAAAGEPCPPRS
nr:hypothetical protein KPHV_75060 [Kitasatospora purpeofusca]